MLAEVGEISSQIRGISYSQGDASDRLLEGYIPILRANNITDEGLNFEDLIYVPRKIIKEHQLLRKGDILIAASSGSKHIVGKAALVKSDISFSFGAFCKVIRPNKNIDFGYFSYYFQTPDYRQKISALSAGANINNLKNEHLNELKIPLPPLETQKKIAAILDKADELRLNDKKILEKYDQLAQSVFLEMFGDPVKNEKGWDISQLNDVVDKITDGEHLNPTFTTEGKPILMATNVLSDRIDFENVKFVAQIDFEKFVKKCRPEIGDLLLVSRGATIGRCTIIRKTEEFCLMGSVILIKTSERLVGDYLNHLFKEPGILKQLLNVSSSSAQQAIYIKHLKELFISIPPKELQLRFTKIINKIQDQRRLSKASLNKSEELFQSLLQRAFRGELV